MKAKGMKESWKDAIEYDKAKIYDAMSLKY